MPKILESSDAWLVLCSIDDELAASRYFQRGLDNPIREFYHGDNRLAHYRKTGEFLPPADYATPRFNVPTIEVSTDGEYDPSLEKIAKQITSSSAA